ncbi:MAG: hypothetical protein J5626_01005 [Lachnospiraceae bacterium]|nr:hypothetical protein [Lachnospiraceae bacterium]
MDFKEFREQLMEDLKERLYARTGEDYEVSPNTVAKLQDEGYDGIVVRKEGEAIGVNIDASSFFRDYSKGEKNYDELVDSVLDVCMQGIEHTPDFNLDEFRDYDIMKERLSMEVVATARNAEMLEKIPHKEIEDMSVVFRFVVDNSNDGVSSILITNDMLNSYGVSVDRLYNDAKTYAPELKPSEIKGMADVLAEMMGIDVSELDREFIGGADSIDTAMYVATTHDKTHGAGIIAYPGFMEMAAEKVGGDFFLLPSSIHEVILVPDNGRMDYRELEKMVREVNETQVSPKEQLSDNVYYYDAKEKIFELAHKTADRRKEKPAEKDSVLKDLSAEKKEADASPKIKADKVHKKEEASL